MPYENIDRRGNRLRLMAVLAHPDDESLGFGGSLAKYATQGVETFVVCATRGQRGRHLANRFGEPGHPGPVRLGRIREMELRRAARVLGVAGVELLDYEDGRLAGADFEAATWDIAERIRAIRPHVVVTFDPFGAYGHPDHIAVSQWTAAATALAGSAERDLDEHAPHQVSKLYYMAWSEPEWAAYQSAFKKLVSTVDGVERQATPWPDWAVTTAVDTADHWRTVWDAVQCHGSQMAAYGALEHLSTEHHRGLWGSQRFYRAFSLVNGGNGREDDLFEGVRAQVSDIPDPAELPSLLVGTAGHAKPREVAR